MWHYVVIASHTGFHTLLFSVHSYNIERWPRDKPIHIQLHKPGASNGVGVILIIRIDDTAEVMIATAYIFYETCMCSLLLILKVTG